MEWVYQCPNCKSIGRSPIKALVPVCTCGDGTRQMEYVDMGVDKLLSAESISMYPATRDSFSDLVDTSDAGRAEYIAHMISTLESERDKPLSVVFSRWELGFIDSIAWHFEYFGSLSEKQFQALMDLFYRKVA